MKYLFKIKHEQGFIALLTVLIIGSATVVMAVGASFLSMGELEMSTTAVKGAKALDLAESCAEEGLRRIRLDTNYFATGKIIDLGTGQCFLDISGSGDERLITAEGLLDNYRKKVELSVSLSGREIRIDHWLEKDN